MAEAHQDLWEAERAYRAADFEKSIDQYLTGMTKYEKMLAQYPDLMDDDSTIEECMLAQLFWRDCLQIVEGRQPSDEDEFPLKDMWLKHQNRKDSLMEEFQRRQRQ
ncbi:MAG: hypothetical protein EHM42_06170 [Planctomycetaceae bacterium]|nr:MAG: hypothetical protein EHM42_06170 [Planctomycetaceae bacterium]